MPCVLLKDELARDLMCGMWHDFLVFASGPYSQSSYEFFQCG